MKKSIAILGLFLMMISLTSFTTPTEIGGQSSNGGLIVNNGIGGQSSNGGLIISNEIGGQSSNGGLITFENNIGGQSSNGGL